MARPLERAFAHVSVQRAGANCSLQPWEIPRLDASVEIKFYGEATRGAEGKGPGTWTGGLEVLAVPYGASFCGVCMFLAHS